jgi:anti-sigma B factor antagonist
MLPVESRAGSSKGLSMGDIEIELVHLDGDALLMVAGEVDASTAPMLHEASLHLSTLTDRVVLDFSRVTFMDSSGLHVLIQHDQREGTTVVLRNASDQVRHLLQITNLAAHFLEQESLQSEVPRNSRVGDERIDVAES